MKRLRDYHEEVLVLGLMVLLLGGALAAWFIQNEDLPNWLSLATLIPLCFGGFLIGLSTFLKWDEADVIARSRAITLTLAFAMMTLGSLAWWLFAPEARG